MIIWGGGQFGGDLNSGGRYCAQSALMAQSAFIFLPQSAANHLGQPCQAIFQNIVGRALFNAFHRRHIAERARDQNHGDIEPFAAQHLQRFHPLPIRQVVIGQHNLGGMSAQRLGKCGFILHDVSNNIEAVPV